MITFMFFNLTKTVPAIYIIQTRYAYRYKGFTIIYIMYKCWLKSIFNMLLFTHTDFNKSHREMNHTEKCV